MAGFGGEYQQLRLNLLSRDLVITPGHRKTIPPKRFALPVIGPRQWHLPEIGGPWEHNGRFIHLLSEHEPSERLSVRAVHPTPGWDLFR